MGSVFLGHPKPGMVNSHDNAYMFCKSEQRRFWDQVICSTTFKRNALAIKINFWIFSRQERLFQKNEDCE